MDHAEARELLEVAAVEPGGFERLIAGDTIEAAALAGHVAGCSGCAAEMESLRRDAMLVRDAVRSLPPADLRDRTLAFVAAVGRPRAAVAAAAGGVPAPGVEAAAPPSGISVASQLARAGRSTSRVAGIRRAGPWAASLAAAVIVAVIGTTLAIGPSRDDTAADQVAALSRLASWSLRIEREPDARQVDLVSTDEATNDTSGTLRFSPATRELVVVVEGLAQPPAGQEYRCWMEWQAERTRVGRMFFAGDVALWVGDVPVLGDVSADEVTFGVTLVPAAGDSLAGDPVLLGEL